MRRRGEFRTPPPRRVQIAAAAAATFLHRRRRILPSPPSPPHPEEAGLLNEKSDVYIFGVLLLEAVTGRDPVDYGRPTSEVHLVEWLKFMVGNRRAEEVVDPDLNVKPTTQVLKRILLIALRCVDPDSEKRPKMGQVVRMLEAEVPHHEDWRSRRSNMGSMEIESSKECSTSSDLDNVVNGNR